MNNEYEIIFYITIILAIFFLIIAIFLFIYFNIPKIFRDIAGISFKKGVKKLKSKVVSDEINQSENILANNIKDSNTSHNTTVIYNNPIVLSKNTVVLQDDFTDETKKSNVSQSTNKLTSVLTDDFKIIKDVEFRETQEIIE